MTTKDDILRAQQRRIEQLEAENKQLQQALELTQIDGGALGAGTSHYRKEVKRLIAERDNLKRALAQWEQFSLDVMRGWQESYDHADSVLFGDSDWQETMPALARLVRYAGDGTIEQLNQSYDTIESRMIEAELSPNDDDPSAIFGRLIRNLRFATVYQAGVFFKAWAWSKAKSPALLAHDILEQWEHGATVEPFAAAALCARWPGDDAPTPGALLEALETARQVESRAMRNKYKSAQADMLGITTRTLYNRLKIVERLRGLAVEVPAEY